MLKFGTFRGTLLSGPYNKDPTIEGTRARMSLHKLQRSSARASELQPSSHRQLGLAVFGGFTGVLCVWYECIGLLSLFAMVLFIPSTQAPVNPVRCKPHVFLYLLVIRALAEFATTQGVSNPPHH